MILSVDKQILAPNKIDNIVKRMAIEIVEKNYEEDYICLVGIYEQGFYFAEMLHAEISKISSKKLVLQKLVLDKAQIEHKEIESQELTALNLSGATVIVCDDVLNTGKTIMYAFQPFLHKGVKKLQTAVLVDRDLRNFPVYADYVGYHLSTTVNEHVRVVLNLPEQKGAYLF